MKAAAEPMEIMKVGRGETFGKSKLAIAVATKTKMKSSKCKKMIIGLTDIATDQIKSAGKFALPGIFLITTRQKQAMKARTAEMFGKTMEIKAKNATTLLKVFPLKALKNSILWEVRSHTRQPCRRSLR